MKILYLSSTSYIDADLSLLKSYKDKGHEVVYVLYIFPNGLRSTLVDIPDIYPYTGVFDASIYGDAINKYKKYVGDIKIYISNITTNHFSLKGAFLQKEIYKVIKKENPDIVHWVGIPGLFSIPYLHLYKKLVVTVHDPVPHENEEQRKLLIMRKLVLKRIKNIILLNKSQTAGFYRHYCLTPRNIYYSRLGNYEVLRMFGTGDNSTARYILFYGRISQYKGVEYLLKAFSKIKSQHKDVKLVVAGKGNFSFDVTPYLNDNQIEFINRFITLDELVSLIKSAQFVVCPYISATQSGVVASVLALNRPLIVTNVGGLPEMIEDGKNGLIVPPKDVDALSVAMAKLLSNPQILQEMNEYIADSAELGDKSWGKIADECIEIYKSL